MANATLGIAMGSLGAAASGGNGYEGSEKWKTIFDPIGIFSNGAENTRKWQEEQNRKAAEETYEYGEKAADNAQARGWETWEKYQSPEAMRKQYEAAGLNPALMYSSGGGTVGGNVTAGAQGTGATRQPVNRAALDMVEQQKQSNTIQSAMALSQIDLNKAQAKKTNAEGQLIEDTNEHKIREAEYRANQAAQDALTAYLGRIWKEYEVGGNKPINYFAGGTQEIDQNTKAIEGGLLKKIKDAEINQTNSVTAAQWAMEDLNRVKARIAEQKVGEAEAEKLIKQWVERHKNQFKVWEILSSFIGASASFKIK